MGRHGGVGGAESALEEAVVRRDRDMAGLVADAVRHREVRLAFQPVVEARAPGRVAFHEAFVRVPDPTGRIVPAADFVAEVEETETGRLLDCLALELAIAELLRAPALRLSVNLSARSLGYPAWRRTLGGALLRAPGLGPRLILEIAEDSVMRLPDLTLAFMRDSQRAGLSFALDDFGAGATQFRFFKRFAFDILKIDGQFIRDVATDPDNQVLVRAFAALAAEFDMVTVAEQVERAEDADLLSRIGIDCLQGYHVAAPTLEPRWRPKAGATGG